MPGSVFQAGADLESASPFNRKQWAKKNSEDFGGKGVEPLPYAAIIPSLVARGEIEAHARSDPSVGTKGHSGKLV